MPFRLRASCVQRQVPSTTTTTTWAAGAGAGLAPETSSFACTLQCTYVSCTYPCSQAGLDRLCTRTVRVPSRLLFPLPPRDADDSDEKSSLESAHFSLILTALICHCPEDQGALSCCASDLRSGPWSDFGPDFEASCPLSPMDLSDYHPLLCNYSVSRLQQRYPALWDRLDVVLCCGPRFLVFPVMHPAECIRRSML